MRTVVFLNPHSRRAANSLAAVQEFFAGHKKFDVVDFIVAKDLKHFDTYIARLRRHKNIDCVIVGSGDGTIVAVLNALKNRKNLVYGFLPLGTTNVFARNLGLPLGFKKSLQVVASQHSRGINLGSVNGVLFVNTADIGLTVQVVKRLHNRLKRYLGPLAYYLVSFRVLVHAKPIRCELQIGKEVTNIQTYNLAAFNGRYYGTVVANKDGSVYNDTFTVLYGTDVSRFGFFRDVHSFALGRQYKSRSVRMISAPQLTLRTEQPQDIQADGEVVSTTPAEIKIVKDAIRVLVPEKRS